MGAFMDYYSERWPKIGAVAAMAMGGVSVLVNRTNRPSLRSLAVMNSMTMAAHQFEEYVEPGTFPGDVNRGIFKSDNPRAFPFNTHSAAVANDSFMPHLLSADRNSPYAFTDKQLGLDGHTAPHESPR